MFKNVKYNLNSIYKFLGTLPLQADFFMLSLYMNKVFKREKTIIGLVLIEWSTVIIDVGCRVSWYVRILSVAHSLNTILIICI